MVSVTQHDEHEDENHPKSALWSRLKNSRMAKPFKAAANRTSAWCRRNADSGKYNVPFLLLFAVAVFAFVAYIIDPQPVTDVISSTTDKITSSLEELGD